MKFLFALGVIMGLLFFFFIKPNEINRIVSPSSQVSPTPTPFQEITIPYLRSREYKSSIEELSEAHSYANYTSYLTSYTSDGLRINAQLTKPIGVMPEGGWPAIIFIHGYIPPTQYETLGKYVDYVDYLARNGFVVFKIDLRGHGNSEGTAGGGYFGSDYVIDTLNAYAALQASDFVNSKKIGLWGHSMAGNIVLRSMAVKKNIPAVVIWAGAVFSYSDRIKYGLNDNSYRPPQTITQRQNRQRAIYDKYGEFDENSPFWKQVAPTNYLTDIQGVIQLNHAVDDDVVNIGYSRDLVPLLDEAKVVYEFYEYQSGGHNINGASFVQAMQRTVEFFKKYLEK
jgi:dipeptidyl aminopeptidase/acylaminoacyl peptidase